MDTFAVIDLGTNTFHLLIAKKEKSGWLLLFRERLYVKLADQGIQRISHNAFTRGVNAMEQFSERLKEYPGVHVKAFGTAALRKSENAGEFIRTVKETTGIDIEVISGSREASLIYRGVRQLIQFDEKPYLIMDIGGGSVEWIIANKDAVLWAHSFQLGAAVLRHEFHKNEPILDEEIRAIRSHLEQETQTFQDALKKFKPVRLVGASGTFDVLASMILDDEQLPAASIFNHGAVCKIIEKILPLNLQEREEMPLLPVSRADLIVVALLLIDFVLDKSNIDEILYSSYAMKEGILEEMLSDLD